ncbi:MAG: nucleoside diphosphate kinase regulator [Rhizobiales bacterium]|jgi:regulator of nucleoside diphosphate kinase|nr:nucleoside diphosphate kinase regulator [Hyphomicrobiales bacterium]OJU34541.1 MAG: nucleoside diphosphate kinase regulator [Rhizobiales bacterium 68-8]
MNQTPIRRRRPPIVIGDLDHQRLTRLASAAPESMADVADELLGELDRARTRPQAGLPAGIVRMGSHVTFRSGDGPQKSVQLVWPGEADIAQGRVSVLTPIGAALIGLTEGQSIGWEDRSGRTHELTVLAVGQADAAEARPLAEARA